jgi:hypothetical protein
MTMPDKKPPMKRSITPQDIRAMREEVRAIDTSNLPVLTEQEADEYISRIPSTPPPRTAHHR